MLAKVLYRSATIAPIISARILKMIGKITMDAGLKISMPDMDFSNPIETPKSANKHPQKRPNTIPNSALILTTDIISTLLMTAIGAPSYDIFVIYGKRLEYYIQKKYPVFF
jgi:hypothetical protein